MTMRQFNPVARGSVLLEALVGMLIFSIGILALVAMQAESIRNTSEARYRNDASYLANQIIGRMWADRPNLASYAHKPGGTPCASTGTASTYGGVSDWLTDVTNTLPNSTATRQQIIIGANNLVTVGLCWQTGNGTPHNLVVSAQIQG
jgi:type IV pilus assembly protein PilV